MKLWRLADPIDPSFARAAWHGAWSEAMGLCCECGASSQHRIQPLILEWEPGSINIGDFTCTGICDGFVLTDRVASTIKRQFVGYETGPVSMVQDSKLRRSQRISRRTKPRIWLPYEGPPLYELWVTAVVPLDRERSSVRLARHCPTCGNERWEIEGIEEYSSKARENWEAGTYEIVTIHHSREPGMGIYLNRKDLGGADIFRIGEFSGWIMCTDEVKELIENHKYTNLAFLEMGEIV